MYVRRQCATPRGRPLDGDNAHPFPRLLYVFPPLLRILCRNKFFLRRIKILEGHSEYLYAPILMSLGGNKTAAALPPPVFLFFYRPVLASPFRNPLSASMPSLSNCATLHCSTRLSKATFRKKSASRRVAEPLAGTTLTFAPVKCYVVYEAVSSLPLVSRSVRRLSNAMFQASDKKKERERGREKKRESTRRLWDKLHAEFLTRRLAAETQLERRLVGSL